ncbi:MAG: hypothetical protein RR891_08085 [Clostridium sp.]|uniref:hypothetical protein n=1 Tax=Clostridium sp. TaxID=1506 RepID=UPI00303E3B6C
MRELYEKVKDILINVDFNELWSGFTRTDFALYNKNSVYLDKGIIPYDNRFLGNTSINYEGENLAIWFLDSVEDVNLEELSANIVHEMFHSYQKSQNETRFPDDIKALSYPNTLENYQLKYNENILLVEALNSIDRNKKIDLLKQIIAARKLRLEKFGELIKYEFVIETLEGCAEYCGTNALKVISSDLYRKHIEDYKKKIVSDKKMLFDIRRCSYFTGTLFLMLLDEIGIEFSKEISNQKLTIFEQVSEFIDIRDISINQPNYDVIKVYFEEEQLRKQMLIDDFYSKNPIVHEGEFTICGYDPMNMFKVDDKIFCSHFIMLKDVKTQETSFIPGPTMLIIEKDSEIIKRYYIG